LYVQRLRDFAQEMERVAEDERRVVAIELHDRVSQPLAAARMRLEEHEQRHEQLDVESRAAHHREIVRLIDDALAESRAITSELAPAAYYELGLGPALAALGQEMERRHGFRCSVECEIPPGAELNEGVTAFIYRCARELLSNAQRHSGVQEAWLRLSPDEGVFRLTVRDRGCGFDLGVVSGGDPRSDGGFGLFSIREHANRLGGDLTIQTRRGSGTCVVVDVPVGEPPVRR
jgi:signal transduction histidine kinase